MRLGEKNRCGRVASGDGMKRDVGDRMAEDDRRRCRVAE